jgi:uncharacterized membrane protein YfcA
VTPTFGQAAFLFCAALIAGTLDAIAGGGGLITVPALLNVMPLDATHLALGTNKGQAVFGSGSALAKYAHAGLIHPGRAVPAFFLGLSGSLVGAQLALHIPPAKLKPVVVVLLFLVAVYLTFRPKPSPTDAPIRPRPIAGAVAAFLIGAYDGFIGPGTGTFLIIAFVALLGDSLAKASANAKVVNFASNLAALGAFAWQGKVVWAFALPMAVAQVIGGVIGAHYAVRVGDTLVRRVVLVVSIGLILKVSYDIAHP